MKTLPNEEAAVAIAEYLTRKHGVQNPKVHMGGRENFTANGIGEYIELVAEVKYSEGEA